MAQLLITNSSRSAAGGVYRLDTETSAVRRISDLAPRGITRGPDGWYVVENGGNVHRLDPESGATTLAAETGLKAAHDIRFHRGSFYIVSSKRNRVVRLSPSFQKEAQVVIARAAIDTCHANCLLPMATQMLLSVFTLSEAGRLEKRLTRDWRHSGKILALDWDRGSFDVVYEPLSQPHSLVQHHGQIYVCQSYTGAICRVDLERGTIKTVKKPRGFVRGIAFSGDRAFVGISVLRAQGNLFQQLYRRMFRWCGVHEYRLPDWKLIRRHPVPGAQIYELALLEE